MTIITNTENQGLSWCQLCRHWWHQMLSSRQPTLPPVITLPPWQLLGFSVKKIFHTNRIYFLDRGKSCTSESVIIFVNGMHRLKLLLMWIFLNAENDLNLYKTYPQIDSVEKWKGLCAAKRETYWKCKYYIHPRLDFITTSSQTLIIRVKNHKHAAYILTYSLCVMYN